MSKAPYVILQLKSGDKTIDLTENLTSFKFEDCLSIDDLLEIRISSEDLYDLIDKGTICTGAEISFHFGYMGGVQSGTKVIAITDIDVSYDTGTLPSVTLRGLGASAILKKSESNTIWKDTTITGIVKKIASKYGMKYKVEEPGTTYKKTPQKGMSDFEFLKSLAKKEKKGEYVVYIKDNTIFFVTRGLNTKSVATYIYGADEDIISFKSSVKDSNKDAATGGLQTTSVNPLTKQVSVGQGEGSESKDAKTTKSKVKVFDFNGKFTGLKDDMKEASKDESGKISVSGVKNAFQSGKYGDVIKKMIPTVDTDKDKITNKISSSSTIEKLKVLTGTLVVEGNPELTADCVITMNGKLFSRDLGTWYVEKVVHNIGSGYICTLEMYKSTKSETKTTKDKNTKKTNAATKNKGNSKTDVTGTSKKDVKRVYDHNGNLVTEKSVRGKSVYIGD